MSSVLLYNLGLVLVTHQTLYVFILHLSFITFNTHVGVSLASSKHVSETTFLRLSMFTRPLFCSWTNTTIYKEQSHLGVVWLSLTGN